MHVLFNIKKSIRLIYSPWLLPLWAKRNTCKRQIHEILDASTNQTSNSASLNRSCRLKSHWPGWAAFSYLVWMSAAVCASYNVRTEPHSRWDVCRVEMCAECSYTDTVWPKSRSRGTEEHDWSQACREQAGLCTRTTSACGMSSRQEAERRGGGSTSASAAAFSALVC